MGHHHLCLDNSPNPLETARQDDRMVVEFLSIVNQKSQLNTLIQDRNLLATANHPWKPLKHFCTRINVDGATLLSGWAVGVGVVGWNAIGDHIFSVASPLQVDLLGRLKLQLSVWPFKFIWMFQDALRNFWNEIDVRLVINLVLKLPPTQQPPVIFLEALPSLCSRLLFILLLSVLAMPARMMKATFLVLLSLSTLGSSESGYSPVYVAHQDGFEGSHKIESLLGQPNGANFDQYSGYVTVDHNAGRAL
ncbi:hypothetical protein HHK36_009987 [Tetracentron sinense]|uniref:Uncharacterized protein n=1 Tax=Tetracentron sinense TaxID=13715 RepID=A0A834ZCZ2_TETSI|nr:hypothetical protein HHK36_009987 [Tetracentron sinense]